ncbi:MAG: hypothetical protein ACREV1_12915 [Gammaproteobacteria bacterium]
MKFTVVKSLQKQQPLALYPDISEYEMYAIGKMTASWALLESQIIKITLELEEHSPHTLPSDLVENNTLQKTLKEFKALIKLIDNPKLKRILESILKRVNNLKTQRHMLTHGIFTWEIKNPEKISVQTPKKKQQPQHFDADKIEILARKIAELNFDINVSQGEEQFYTARAETGYGISRSFAILVTGANSNDPTLKLPPVKKKSKPK